MLSRPGKKCLQHSVLFVVEIQIFEFCQNLGNRKQKSIDRATEVIEKSISALINHLHFQ